MIGTEPENESESLTVSVAYRFAVTLSLKPIALSTSITVVKLGDAPFPANAR